MCRPVERAPLVGYPRAGARVSTDDSLAQVAPLVRLLVWLSDVMNRKLELGCQRTPPEEASGGFGSPMRSAPEELAPAGLRVRFRKPHPLGTRPP